ncbi:MAG: bifunctional 5,10-methylenetetrahydrofolate dehydrogenase/5,10-methenyltetrahydrofolate cyclohydrolase [Bdellovibrionaceae bacterium]|nr:bifunctional 5,10-methylenetetrahydrofolate dehydrogenase/5,10-methenyltetrahydrofolate cyclohydrolase [Pseudobdellovibrionaceae bacterium]MDW8190208.1 bifunctional 5,10-methylenetetrahydrofolate dehydrogenase/5,10-methenyltetrahydrofolate cyclohydrolase [Pseudobdellovibrionaceae bacterium]
MMTNVETIVLDGKGLAQRIKQQLRNDVTLFQERVGRAPQLVVVLVGQYGPSQIYVRNKIRAAHELGITGRVLQLSEQVSEHEFTETLVGLNQDPTVDAVLVQLPLPSHLPSELVFKYLSPEKDADGLSYYNLGLLLAKNHLVAPCTPAGIIELLRSYQVTLTGKKVVVVGRSLIVGKPLSVMLTHEDATVTLAHSKTKNLKELCRDSDICIFAAHQKQYFNRDFIRQNGIVIDVGIHQETNGKVVGDVDFASMMGWASMVTPVPGGVGPLTVAMLLRNTVILASKRNYVRN